MCLYQFIKMIPLYSETGPKVLHRNCSTNAYLVSEEESVLAYFTPFGQDNAFKLLFIGHYTITDRMHAYNHNRRKKHIKLSIIIKWNIYGLNFCIL